MKNILRLATFEDYIAHFKAHPPIGERIELDFTSAEVSNIERHAAKHDCTTDVFLNAVLAWFIAEKEDEDRRKSRETSLKEARNKLRDWVLTQASLQGKRFPDIQANPNIPMDDLIRAACVLGHDVNIATAQSVSEQDGTISVNLG